MRARRYVAILALLLTGSTSQNTHPQKPFGEAPVILNTWDDAAIAALEVPFADLYGAKTYAVKGHPFRLTISEDDRKALIASLKGL